MNERSPSGLAGRGHVAVRGEYVEIDSRLGFVEIAGAGAPLVCIHTAGQSGRQWRDVLFQLPDRGYQVIVPDLPGHGRSDNPANGPVDDLSVYTAWLAALLAELEVERPLVVGCSIGGKIALELAATKSVGVRAVVAMESDAYNADDAVSGLVRGLEDSASPSRGDRTFYGTLASVGRGVSADRAAEVADLHRREDPIVSTSDLIAWSRHDIRDQLASITCPVRLVAGEDDFWIQPSRMAWTAEHLPNCVYERLPGVGHYPMEEIVGFPELLTGWLAELLGRPSAAVVR